MSKFILGSGISGLIWKLYNPEYEVISPIITRPGTDIKVVDPFVRSKMIWTHDTPETRQLLVDLGWKTPEKMIKKSKIGYYDNGVIRDKLTPELKAVLVAKKMTPWNENIQEIKENKENSPRLSLSAGEEMTNFMNVLDVDHGEMIYRLQQRCPTTHGYVGEITATHIGITNAPPTQDSGYIYQSYDHLVSTIPAPLFEKAWYAGNPDVDSSLKLESLPITFVTTKSKPNEYDGDYEMIYMDDTLAPTRMSKLGLIYCLEFTGDISRETIEKMYPELRIRDYWQLPQGRIKSQTLTPPEKVTFSGRFATWNHSITMEHVVNEAIKNRRNK